MLGAIIGDICGSIYERHNHKTEEPQHIILTGHNCRLTDDTVLTIATAEALLQGRNYTKAYKEWGCRYPHAGYGKKFKGWMYSDSLEPYNSFGNGSAMRVAPVGWAFETLEETLAEAKRSAEVTHNHPEGIKGAQSVAAAIFLARHGKSKQEIKKYIESAFGSDLTRTTAQIRPVYKFDVTCQGSVPEAIICFLESNDFVHAIQLAISIGGDTDTIACITGSIAEAFYRGIPDDLIDFIQVRLPDEMLQIIEKFHKHYHVGVPPKMFYETEKKMQSESPLRWSYKVTDTFYAGEYPFKKDAKEGEVKLKRLTDFGIKHFIDLTEGYQKEYLTEYSKYLPSGCTYLNLPTVDYTVPDFENLKKVHDFISLSKEKVYLHCKGGYDRTGVTVATWFIYLGKTVEEARKLYFEKAAEIRKRYPHQPLIETDWSVLEQYQEWLPRHKKVTHGKENSAVQNKILGGILGLAVADALGVPVEFQSRESLRHNPVTDMRGFGVWHQPPGTWSDDTSLTLCLMDSWINKGTVP